METVGELSEISGVEEFEWKNVEWRIKKFSSLPAEVDKYYDGPVFFFAGEVWHLRIYPNGSSDNITKDGQIINSKGSIGLYLYRTTPGPPISLEYFLSFKTLQEKVNSQRHFTDNFERIEGKGFYGFISISELLKQKSELLPSGVLTVVCKMRCPKTADISSNIATEKCSYCKSTLDSHENLSSHQQKCMDRPIKCPDCNHVVVLKDWFHHKCQNTVAKDDTATKKCSYCKSTLDTHEDLSSHQQKCMDKPIKCPECNDVVDLKNWYDHKCQKIGAEGVKKFLFQNESRLPCSRQNQDGYVIVWNAVSPQHKAIQASEKLLHDLKTIMVNGDHSDIVVKVKGEEFQLHKNILAGRNPYFNSMFKTDMKEKSSGIVTIEDCEPDTFRSFVHFIYTGKVDRLSTENVCALYETADKYQEDQLKKECLQFMMNTLSVDSFCDYFVLVVRHDEKELFQKGIELFTTESKEIARSVKWQVFVQEFPIQANELFIKTLDRHIK